MCVCAIVYTCVIMCLCECDEMYVSVDLCKHSGLLQAGAS